MNSSAEPQAVWRKMSKASRRLHDVHRKKQGSKLSSDTQNDFSKQPFDISGGQKLEKYYFQTDESFPSFRRSKVSQDFFGSHSHKPLLVGLS